MDITSDWKLTIHHWPRATDAGVRPQLYTGFSLDECPALYRPTELVFSHPPSREDLLVVVARTPWMASWQETLLPVLAQNQWQIITAGYKGASVEFKDDSGRVVGRVEVWRQDHHCNVPYAVPFFGVYPGSDIDGFPPVTALPFEQVVHQLLGVDVPSVRQSGRDGVPPLGREGDREIAVDELEVGEAVRHKSLLMHGCR